jgi:hypothetical protein
MNATRSRVMSLTLILFATFAMADASPAQAPDAGAAQAPAAMPGQGPGGPGQRPRGPRPKPTNIQVLPKDISGDDVIKLMREYEQQLGVECEYCHAMNPATHRIDPPSDANPRKEEARTMIRMTDEINAKYLTTLSSATPPPQVSCGTCHRGMAKPPEFVPKPRTQGAPGGGAMPAAKPPM